MAADLDAIAAKVDRIERLLAEHQGVLIETLAAAAGVSDLTVKSSPPAGRDLTPDFDSRKRHLHLVRGGES